MCEKPTYRCRISFGISPAAMRVTQSLLGTRAGLKLVIKTLVPQSWAHYIQRVSLPKPRTVTKQTHPVKEMILHHFRFGSLFVKFWFGIVFGLALHKPVPCLSTNSSVAYSYPNATLFHDTLIQWPILSTSQIQKSASLQKLP